MANRFWVGGTATWDGTAGTKWALTTGGAGGQAVPTAADDVFFDANSTGTTTLSSSSVARSITCTGFVSTISHPAATTLTIGDGTAGAGNVALLFVSGMTYTLGDAATSAISFVSTSATQQTIATGTKVLGNVTWSGVGSSYLLSDNMTATGGTLTHSNGTLNLNAKTIAAVAVLSANTNLRTLTLGAATLNLTNAGTAWSLATVTNLTFSGASSTINITGAGATFITAGGQTYGTVTLTGSGIATLNGGSTYTTLTRTGTAVKTDAFLISGNHTITGTFTISGNSLTNRIAVSTTQINFTSTFTAAVVSLSNTDFTDITGAGAASPFTGTSLGDMTGNSGITFTTPATQTWSGNTTGNWSTAANWTSRVPLPQDNVLITGLTSGTITQDMPRVGKDVDFTSSSGGTMAWTLTNKMFGSFTMVSGVSFSGASSIEFLGRGTHTITSAGKTWANSQLAFNSVGGTYSMLDALTHTGANGVTILGGTFTTNSFALTSTFFSAVGGGVLSRTVNLGTSTVTLTSTGAVWSALSGLLTLSAASATIVMSSASASSRTFGGGGNSYGTLTYTVAGSTGSLLIQGSNTFGTINFSDVTNARTLTFTSGTTTTITSAFNVNGTSGKLMTINASTGGVVAILAKSSGIISCVFLSIQDSSADAGARWYAGQNSTNVSGNTGWIFNSPGGSVYGGMFSMFE